MFQNQLRRARSTAKQVPNRLNIMMRPVFPGRMGNFLKIDTRDQVVAKMIVE